MSVHALYSPSAAHRWMHCPGSMAYDDNTKDGESSVFADDGTASHHWGALALNEAYDAAHYIGQKLTINEVAYECDEERADFIQVYLDKCRQLCIGGLRFVEHWVDLSSLLGPDQGGTADFGVIHANLRTVMAVDLKYGVGERVDASYDGKPNPQLALYAYGLLLDAQLLSIDIDKVVLCIVQPRLDHIDEKEFTVRQIIELAMEARAAAGLAGQAMILNPAYAQEYMHPSEKACRWCRAKAECPKLARFVQETVAKDFEEIDEVNEPDVPTGTPELSAAGRALPLIEQWCSAVRSAIHEKVSAGEAVIGVDGKPLKFVAGDEGKRAWTDPTAAEGLLLGNPKIGPDKAYQPRKIITAPQAAKILDKKRTAEQWEPFKALIKRAPGRPVLALGSDPRPAYSGSATAHEFDDESDIGVE